MAETIHDYAPPVSQLLTLGDCRKMREWPDYLALGLTPQHTPATTTCLAARRLLPIRTGRGLLLPKERRAQLGRKPATPAPLRCQELNMGRLALRPQPRTAGPSAGADAEALGSGCCGA